MTNTNTQIWSQIFEDWYLSRDHIMCMWADGCQAHDLHRASKEAISLDDCKAIMKHCEDYADGEPMSLEQGMIDFINELQG